LEHDDRGGWGLSVGSDIEEGAKGCFWLFIVMIVVAFALGHWLGANHVIPHWRIVNG
jgi:hypothetical protein